MGIRLMANIVSIIIGSSLMIFSFLYYMDTMSCMQYNTLSESCRSNNTLSLIIVLYILFLNFINYLRLTNEYQKI